jgi:2-dehydro-3-deoxyphosphogluconate aldolase / (4S)-4-hydroxy-2-oxoglutarate aldolase
VIEIALRSPGAEACLAAVASIDGLCIGAGTVLTRDQADRACSVGARFVVSPGIDSGVIEACRENGVDVLPGIATPTEAQLSLSLGLGTVKVFPVQTLGGPTFLRALSGPFPTMRWVPTGGINAEVVATYVRLPSVVAVGGSWMLPEDAVRARSWDTVERLARSARDLALSAGRPG